MIKKIYNALNADLEAEGELKRLGSGWYSGVAALVLALAGLVAVLCIRYSHILTVPEIREIIDLALFRLILHVVLIAGFLFAVISLVLREKKVLGFAAVSLILVAIVLGGSRVETNGEFTSGVYFGLDWFMLNLLFTGILFVPLERLFHRQPQALFRPEWREDLFYFFISSIMVQSLTYLSLAPSMTVLAHLEAMEFRTVVGNQPLWLQLVEIMFLTDLVQYWVHRAFHRIPFLWRFHAIHHSAKMLD